MNGKNRATPKKEGFETIRILVFVMGIVCFTYLIMLSPLLKDIVPSYKKNFRSWESYEKWLDYNSCLDFFVDEKPESASDMKYSWFRMISNKSTAYSMYLNEDDYLKIQEKQREKYADWFETKNFGEIIYEHTGDEYYFIKDSELYKEELEYVNEVLHQPEDKSQYYYLIISQYGSGTGEAYSGIILNDATGEVIEFYFDRMTNDKMR